MARMAFRASGASALPVTAYYPAPLSGRLDEGTLTDLLPDMAVPPHPKVTKAEVRTATLASSGGAGPEDGESGQ